MSCEPFYSAILFCELRGPRMHVWHSVYGMHTVANQAFRENSHSANGSVVRSEIFDLAQVPVL